MKKKLSLIILIIFLPVLALLTKSVLAQQVVKITAIPPRVENLTAEPGEVITRGIKVRNLSDQEMALETKISDFIVQDDKGVPIFLSDKAQTENRWALSQWVNVSPTRFILKPGETQALDLVIVVPEDAMPGGHYAAVLYQPTAGRVGTEGSATEIIPNVASLIYLTVSGDINEDAFVKRMDIPKFSEYGPIDIATEIENLSDVHIKPLATVRVYNLLNRLSTSLKLEELNIFPGKSRLYQNTWQRKWLFGRYKAVLDGTYGNQGQTLLATAYFWVVPWKIILIALLVSILTILLIAYFKKKREKKTELPQQ